MRWWQGGGVAHAAGYIAQPEPRLVVLHSKRTLAQHRPLIGLDTPAAHQRQRHVRAHATRCTANALPSRRRLFRWCCVICCCRGSCDLKRAKNDPSELLFGRRMKVNKVRACVSGNKGKIFLGDRWPMHDLCMSTATGRR